MDILIRLRVDDGFHFVRQATGVAAQDALDLSCGQGQPLRAAHLLADLIDAADHAQLQTAAGCGIGDAVVQTHQVHCPAADIRYNDGRLVQQAALGQHGGIPLGKQLHIGYGHRILAPLVAEQRGLPIPQQVCTEPRLVPAKAGKRQPGGKHSRAGMSSIPVFQLLGDCRKCQQVVIFRPGLVLLQRLTATAHNVVFSVIFQHVFLCVRLMFIGNQTGRKAEMRRFHGRVAVCRVLRSSRAASFLFFRCFVMCFTLIQQPADLVEIKVPGGWRCLESLRPAVLFAQPRQELRQIPRLSGVLDAIFVDDILSQFIPQGIERGVLHFRIDAAAGKLLIGTLAHIGYALKTAIAVRLNICQRIRVFQGVHVHISALGDQPGAEVHKAVIRTAVLFDNAGGVPQAVLISQIHIGIQDVMEHESGIRSHRHKVVLQVPCHSVHILSARGSRLLDQLPESILADPCDFFNRSSPSFFFSLCLSICTSCGSRS